MLLLFIILYFMYIYKLIRSLYIYVEPDYFTFNEYFQQPRVSNLFL